MSRNCWLALAGTGCAALAAGPATADQVTFNFSGANPSGHAASASFTFDDADMTVTVRIMNDIGSSFDSLGSRALTGLFWDMSPGTLPYTGVTGSAGSPVNNLLGYDPTQLWAFRTALGPSSTPFGTQFGLGAAGFGAFGPNNMLAPNGPFPAPNGIDGGILSLTGNAYTGQNQNPMWREFVEFKFQSKSSLFAGGLENISISNVYWQFGSSFSEPSVTFIPLPESAALGAAALAALGGFGWARRRALAAELDRGS